MWDEISVNLPMSDDTEAMVEFIRKAVEEETQENARIAENEWRRGTRGDGLSQSDAAPKVSLRPSGTGIEILVRYVTRASERFAVRNRLYQRVIDLLHKEMNSRPKAPAPAVEKA
jgi:small-conductance mechanosensitive channel